MNNRIDAIYARQSVWAEQEDQNQEQEGESVFIAAQFGEDRHGDHRDLHSFPTRRSSDLIKLSAAPFLF